jgi:hypothetical protein
MLNTSTKHLAELGSSSDRLAELNARHQALRRIIELRGVEYADDPLGSSGFYLRRFKVQGSVLTAEYTLDTSILRELREIEKQAAIEMGERMKPNGAGAAELRTQELMQKINAGYARMAAARATREEPQPAAPL